GIGFWAHRSGHQTGQAQVLLGRSLSQGSATAGDPIVRQAGSGDGPRVAGRAWSCVATAVPILCGSVPILLGSVYAAMDHERRSSLSGD
ncbi:hypothetical protein, partial [Methylobacterium sp. CCH5-D2]|uniref:hypothetical protein n=1 Tax=Methylobacterium sp. CCH5-D2 TaxID=1768765 RepID=UPI001AEC8792